MTKDFRSSSTPNGERGLAHLLDDVIEDLQAKAPPPATAARRGGAIRTTPDTTKMRIVEREGILIVEDDSIPPPTVATRRSSTNLGRAQGKTVWECNLARLEQSQITAWLDSLDKKLTPNQGLRLWRGGQIIPTAEVARTGRILLLVHGTFSKSEAFFEGISQSSIGEEFLRWISKTYSQVLTFDHPTLAVSPMINARSLGLLFSGTVAQIDIICHSRGGLVTRWWLEAFDRAPAETRRVVFVGSPLAGTGLAAPPNLRQSLNLLSNIANALGMTAAAVPFVTVLTGIFQVVTSVTKLIAKTPAVDAAVALVPGLAAQSRVGNAAELLSLRSGKVDPGGRYFAVRSNFQSEKVGWQFWRYFRRPLDRARDLAADVVFDGDNDLVVDSNSMVEMSDTLSLSGIEQVLDFGTTDQVHHTNYFAQNETLEFIRSKLDRVVPHA